MFADENWTSDRITKLSLQRKTIILPPPRNSMPALYQYGTQEGVIKFYPYTHLITLSSPLPTTTNRTGGEQCYCRLGWPLRPSRTFDPFRFEQSWRQKNRDSVLAVGITIIKDNFHHTWWWMISMMTGCRQIALAFYWWVII